MANVDNLLKSVYSAGHVEKTPLTVAEETMLGEIVQSPSSTPAEKRAAIHKLVLRNIFLVLKIAHKYKRKEFDFEDLVSYGILGLFRAAEKYDPSRKNRFAAYARHWIKDAIIKALREYSGLPKIPVFLVKNLWKVSRIVSQNDSIDNRTLATQAQLPIKDVVYLRSLLFKFVQFDGAYSKIDSATPEDSFIRHERERLIVERLEQCLTPDQFRVVVYSCALCGYPKMTLVDIGRVFGIKNPQYVRVTAFKALKNDPTLQNLYKESFD